MPNKKQGCWVYGPYKVRYRCESCNGVCDYLYLTDDVCPHCGERSGQRREVGRWLRPPLWMIWVSRVVWVPKGGEDRIPEL